MYPLSHRVKIFVCRRNGPGPEYLLLRGDQGIESFWGPVHGEIGLGEKLESAIRREVLDDTGLDRPLELIDLGMPRRWVLGDEEVIEWHYGFRTLSGDDEVQLATGWSAFRWAEFHDAYPRLELDQDRAAITRLHTILAA